jgi:apolipoprotein N-acyltransferase
MTNGWPARGGALLLGALAVLGFAPYSLPHAVLPAPTFALAGLFWLLRDPAWRARDAALLGSLFGLGVFLAGVSWVYVSLATFSGLDAPVAALATLLFCAYLALFPALACALYVRWRAAPRAMLSALLFAATWTFAEWLRGTLFTGFPWLAVGYAHTPPSPLAGYAPVLGVYGVSGVSVLCATALVQLMDGTRQQRLQLGVLILGLFSLGALLSAMPWTQPVGEPTRVSLLQGDVPQSLKWDPERLQLSFDRYLALARNGNAKKSPPAQLLVLPETALPLIYDAIPREVLAALAANSDVLFGAAVGTDDDGYVNAAVAIAKGMPGAPQVYAKRHLVPFGEYAPPGFDWFFKLLRIPMSAFTAGAAQQPPLTLATQRIAPNICYEDLFGEELLLGLADASVLINLSNTAWFGKSLAQPQHLQIAQMRALETGRVMLRATNSGMTAMISPDGEVVAQLPPFSIGRLDVLAQGYSGLTPYAKWGNALALTLAAGIIAVAARRKRQSL